MLKTAQPIGSLRPFHFSAATGLLHEIREGRKALCALPNDLIEEVLSIGNASIHPN